MLGSFPGGKVLSWAVISEATNCESGILGIYYIKYVTEDQPWDLGRDEVERIAEMVRGVLNSVLPTHQN